jgi:hypothetical protein
MHLIFEGLHGSLNLKYNTEQKDVIPLVVNYEEDGVSISFDEKFAFGFNNRLERAKIILANELKIGKLNCPYKYLADSEINAKNITKERTEKTTLDITKMLQEKNFLEGIENENPNGFEEDLPF